VTAEAANEPAVMKQFLTCLSCEECFKFVPTVARFETEIAQLPTDWAVRLCGFLEYLRDYGGPLGTNLQQTALAAFAPGVLRKDLLTYQQLTRSEFLFEAQLLGVMKFAMLGGADVIPDVLSDAQQRAFFWALMLYCDLFSNESPIKDQDDAARFELRSLAFVAQEVPGNVMARAYALWVDLPSRPELTGSTYYMDSAAEFAHAANGHPVTDYITVVSALRTHVGDTVHDSIIESLGRWPFDAAARFASSLRAAELTATLRSFAADRAEMTALFSQMPADPKFLGVAMLPFMHRPVYVAADGKYLIVSMRLLLDGLYSHAYWRVWEHLKDQHGDDGKALSAQFTQFYGQVLERYVVELLRSVYDADGTQRVYPEADAQPPTGAADAVVFLDDRVILVEVTRTELRYFETLLKGDLENLDRDLVRTAAKAKQVATAAQSIQAGTVTYPGQTNANVLPVERIVVLPEPLPRFVFVTQHIRAALQKAGVDPDATIISVSELEEALRAGDLLHLSTVIAAWKADPDFADGSLHDFIQLRGYVVPMAERAPYIIDSGEAFKKKVITEMAFDPTYVEATTPAPPPAVTGEAQA
jgi:hypothetical protein